MNVKDRVTQHYVKEYGELCYELAREIEFLPDNLDEDLDTAIDRVETNFLCEWDCDVESWYKLGVGPLLD